MKKKKEIQDSEETRNIGLNTSLKFLSYRARSKKEIADFLIKKGFQQVSIDHVILKLQELKFIDDTEFAKWWVEQRSEFRPKGNIILKNELQQKGIDRNIIDYVLDGIANEEEAATKLFDKNKNKFGDLKNRENFQKAAQFFQRRGFRWETVEKILRKKEE